MATTGIRLDVEPWMYKILCKEQEAQRQKDHKKPALSSLLLDYTKRGMVVSYPSVQKIECSELEKASFEHDLGYSVQNNAVKIANSQALMSEESAKMVENLLIETQKLDERERRVSLREKEVKKMEDEQRWKELELAEKAQKILEKWNEFLEDKEQAQNKNIEEILQKRDFEHQTKELTEAKEQHRKLRAENKHLQEEILAILEKIDKQTEKNLFMDTIAPLLPSIIGVIGFFMMNKKIDGVKDSDLSPALSDVNNVIKHLSESDQQKISKILSDTMNLHLKPSSLEAKASENHKP